MIECWITRINLSISSKYENETIIVCIVYTNYIPNKQTTTSLLPHNYFITTSQLPNYYLITTLILPHNSTKLQIYINPLDTVYTNTNNLYQPQDIPFTADCTLHRRLHPTPLTTPYIGDYRCIYTSLARNNNAKAMQHICHTLTHYLHSTYTITHYLHRTYTITHYLQSTYAAPTLSHTTYRPPTQYLHYHTLPTHHLHSTYTAPTLSHTTYTCLFDALNICYTRYYIMAKCKLELGQLSPDEIDVRLWSYGDMHVNTDEHGVGVGHGIF